MNVIGDLERLFAQLWPFRVPIGIAIVILLAVVALVGYRRGWHRPMLAHPRVTGTVVVMVLVVAIPVGWLLGSPLLIRTELVEESPATAAVSGAAVDASVGGSPRVLLEGEFAGADDFHFGEGTATVVEVDPGRYVLSLTDFSVLNGPDLFVYLSPDPAGWAPDAVNLGSLKATDGSFSYDIPDGLDPARIGSAIIWCRAFSVLFASAPLEPPAA